MSDLAPFESSIAERYHEETKYSEEGLRRDAMRHTGLDWASEPPPFKLYDGPRLLLPPDGLPIRRPGPQGPEAGESAPAGQVDLGRLSRLLWHTNGCTRIVGRPGALVHFRAAPSAGARYPTEVYVLTRGVARLEDGAHNYQVLDHSLARVAGDARLERLAAACFAHPAFAGCEAAVVLTAIWFRSSWRYRERGYRRALLDSGHVLGNLVLAAASEGLTAVPLCDFRDDDVAELLDLDPTREGCLVVAPLLAPDAAASLPWPPPRTSPVTEWRRAIEAVESEDPDAPETLITALHLAGRMDDDARPAAAPQGVPPAGPDRALTIAANAGRTTWSALEPVTHTIAVRRSTRRFRPEPAGKDELLRALAYAVPAETDDAQQRLFVPELIRTYVVSLDVVGLPPGSYAYDTEPRRLIELSRGQFASAMHHLGLGQDIFLNAAVVVVHTVDLTRAVERFGDRVYRSLALDAGHIGQRLNLAALREGLGVSGCGGYYDDEMNRVLRIPENQAVVYVTTLGVPE